MPDSPSPAPVSVVLLGSHGLMGTALRSVLQENGGFEVRVLERGALNLTNLNSFERILDELDFQVLINAAASTAVDDCEVQGELAYLVNAQAPGLLARICARRGARMMHFSTDFVFDGRKPTPYTEDDAPNPLSVYGKTKWRGEQLVHEAAADHLIVRLSWLFGTGRPAFPEWVISHALQQDLIRVVGDKTACPTYNLDAAQAFVPWLWDRQKPGGLWHYCQPDPCAWSDYAQHVLDCAAALGLPLRTTQVTPIPISSLPGLVAPRPPQSALDTTKFTQATGHAPPPWKQAMVRHLQQQFAQGR